MILSNQGKFLSLRQTVPDDAPILVRAYQDEEFTRMYRSNTPDKTEEEWRETLAKRLEHSPIEVGFVEFMIEHCEKGPIGVVVLGDYTPLHNRAEFLIGLFDEKDRKTTYGLEATLLVLDIAFNVYKINKIYTYVYEYNEYSEKNTVKLGFKQEGLLEEHHFSNKEKCFVGLYINGMTLKHFRQNEKLRRFSLRLLERDITLPYQEITLNQSNAMPIEESKALLDAFKKKANQPVSSEEVL